jgi:hypothetical protein
MAVPQCDALAGAASVTLVINAIKAAGLMDINVWLMTSTGYPAFDWTHVDLYISLAVKHQADLRAVVLSRDEPLAGEDYPANLISAISATKGNLTAKIPVGASDAFSGPSVSFPRSPSICSRKSRTTWREPPTFTCRSQ